MGYYTNNLTDIAMSTLQWQTGPIPNATGHNILIMEASNHPHMISMSLPALGFWYPVYCWDIKESQTPNELLFRKGCNTTGRWYIQIINLPSDPVTADV
jgi:hypothetical protein